MGGLSPKNVEGDEMGDQTKVTYVNLDFTDEWSHFRGITASGGEIEGVFKIGPDSTLWTVPLNADNTLDHDNAGPVEDDDDWDGFTSLVYYCIRHPESVPSVPFVGIDLNPGNL